MISYVIYNLAVIASLLFAYTYEKVSVKASIGVRRLLICCSFFSLFLLSVLRFDVGPDYETYVQIYYNIINGVVDVTYDKVLFGYLSLFFSHFDRGYLLVFGVYSFLTLYFVYRVLLDRNIIVWGLVLFCFVGFYLDSFDRVRQVLAVAIFFYSIKYIENRKIVLFAACLFLASLAHFSAFLLLPVYFYNRFEIKPFVAFSILSLLFMSHLIGLSGVLQSYIYTHIPYYNKIYGDSQFMEAQGGFGTGLGFIFNIFLIFYAMAFLRGNRVIRNILFTAGFLMLLAPGNLNIMRFAQYFYISLIIALPYAFTHYKHSLLSKLVAFCLLFIFFQAQQGRNNYSYQSVFSDSFDKEYFIPRVSDRPSANQNQ